MKRDPVPLIADPAKNIKIHIHSVSNMNICKPVFMPFRTS